MSNSNRLIHVSHPYTAIYPNPIHFKAGEVITVERADPEYPGWYWCRATTAEEGWVHNSFLNATTGTTTAARDYSARELTVRGGEHGELLETQGGWVVVRLNGAQEGWLPENHVQPLPS